MRKILFVINTMGHAGAETALIELLRRLESEAVRAEIFLYVITGQGELIRQVPSYIRLLNSDYDDHSVLTSAGKRRMYGKVIRAFFRNGGCIRKGQFFARNMISMLRKGHIQTDKLLWRIMSDGAQRFEDTFDLAVAWLEGASAYYVADYVKARKKAAFIHIDYESAGYTREMDRGCFSQFDRIFAVSDETEKHFTAFYPEYAPKTAVINNFIAREEIIRRSKAPGGFSDTFEGIRILSVGRLSWQKAYDLAVEALKILKDQGYCVRWYVLGAGEQRKKRERKIRKLRLKEDFLLLGMAENPYPYYAQTDVYVQASRFEGKSIAIREAQVLGCAIIVSDCNGNREQVSNHQDGILCELTPCAIAESIAELCKNEKKRKELGKAAQLKNMTDGQELKKLWSLLEKNQDASG